jgi:hypothetical protein
MRVYKKKYIKRGFTSGKEWMTKSDKGMFEEYIGPIVFYVGQPYGGEAMTIAVEKKMELYPFEASKQKILYNEINPEYDRNFVEPVPYKHKLTEEEIEKGEYSRYFTEILNTGAVCEVDKPQHIYFKKNSTPYHKNIVSVEIKLKLSTQSITLNYEAILEAKMTIKEIHRYILPTDYMKWLGKLKGISMAPDGSRIYEGGNMLVPTNLPFAYQLGNNGGSEENKTIPPRQNCENCIFYKDSSCTIYDANVRPNYWCAKFVYDVNDDVYYKPKIKIPK